VADLRIPSGAQALVPAASPARADALKAAQRAFFNQALAEVQATAPVRPQTSEATAAPAASAPRASADPTDAASPGHYLRPGSLLDIKV
jgi:hypothetical protein